MQTEVGPESSPAIAIGRVHRRGSVSGGYTSNDVKRLVQGVVFDPDQGVDRPAGGATPSDDASWLMFRARIERMGHIDSEEMSEVLDIERAVTQLQQKHPITAMAIALMMFGWDAEELEETFRRFHTSAAMHIEKGEAYCQAYLSGKDPEKAFLSVRREK